ncbi:MAG: Hsp20/alpha crystallin family protein [Candidatus Kerfeldbacteria bacterium]|nr:Hsp20/alpha crystallin family protein [Candidatus Kerfeldbacteria bacterium]
MRKKHQEEEEILLADGPRASGDFFQEVVTEVANNGDSVLEVERERNLDATEEQEEREAETQESEATLEDPDPLFNGDSYEGQLSVDVYETDTEIVILSTIAGVNIEDLDVTVNHDMVTIKGKRSKPPEEVSEDQYLYQECYWGGFSRSIILPEDVDVTNAAATLEAGILTVRLPKTGRSSMMKLDIQER